VTKGIKGKNNTGERSKLKNKGKNKKDYLIEDQLTKEGRAIFKPKGERIFSMSDDGKTLSCRYLDTKELKDTIDIPNSTIESSEEKLSFTLTTSKRKWNIKAKSKKQYLNWLKAFKYHHTKNGNSDSEDKEKKPKKSKEKGEAKEIVKSKSEDSNGDKPKGSNEERSKNMPKNKKKPKSDESEKIKSEDEKSKEKSEEKKIKRKIRRNIGNFLSRTI